MTHAHEKILISVHHNEKSINAREKACLASPKVLYILGYRHSAIYIMHFSYTRRFIQYIPGLIHILYTAESSESVKLHTLKQNLTSETHPYI